MTKKQKLSFFIVIGIVIAVILVVINLIRSGPGTGESIQTAMKDAVLHESNKIRFLGMEVNPGLISAFCVTGIFLVLGLLIRFVLVPRFRKIPGKLQMVLELVVGLFDNMARTNSPHMNRFLGAYIFMAGAYIFVGTIFELFGVQAVTTEGTSISLPAPLADINGAICMGCLSYLVIMSGGLIANGLKGVGKTLKDFSLPISMSFRLFGALLSGALVTELVYFYPLTRYGFPIIVGVLFTLLHALIQAYVLTTLTSVFYGEVTEKTPKKPKKIRQKAKVQTQA
ncbi:MAG: F0F1 ATP synthase subunit A [Parasporobacterium sp.]|nr:F0F1 ATP synthase subunit A [Parasporobacterium sp.]